MPDKGDIQLFPSRWFDTGILYLVMKLASENDGRRDFTKGHGEEARVDVPYIGAVTKDDRFDLYISEAIPIGFLRGHKCRFALEGYVEDRRRDDFHRAIKNALAIDDSVLSKAQPFVLQYCRDMVALYKEDGPLAVPIEHPSDVWKHVHFGSDVYVSRRDRDDHEDGIYLSLECNCEWEVEHGLQIVLRDGLEITKVGPFDGHVTNSDAFADPKLHGVVYKGIL